MFNPLSNTAFNNTLFGAGTISFMRQPVIHLSMQRLYLAAAELQGVRGQSAVARLLNLSPQVVKNWESRGISQQGAISAQAVIGCNVAWLLSGAGPMASDAHTARKTPPPCVLTLELQEAISRLSHDALHKLENQLRVQLDLPPIPNGLGNGDQHRMAA